MVEHYTLVELKKALAENSLWTGERIPITKSRAVALVNNPRASDDDIILLVLYNKEKKVMGYYAVVPDFIFVNGKKEKLGWLGAFWAETSPENATAIITLYLKACEIWDFKVASSSFSKFSERLFDKSRMVFDFKLRKGFKAILRFNSAYWIGRKFSSLKFVLPFFRFADTLLNLFWDLRLKIWSVSTRLNDLQFEFINEIREHELIEFIGKMNKNDLTRKTAEDLNYRLLYSDLLEVPLRDYSDGKCFFGTQLDRYDLYAIKIMDNSLRVVAFAMISIENQKLLIKYLFAEGSHKQEVFKLLGKIAVKKRVDMVECYNEDINTGFRKSKLPFVYTKYVNTRSVINNRYKKYDFNPYYLHDGDGA